MKMIAVIKTGGKQYKVEEGSVIKVEKLDQKEGSEAVFKEVLLISDKAGHKLNLGAPFVSGAQVKGKILEEKKDKKIMVIKFKRKTRYRKKRGHRQWFTKVKIEKITV